jgi:hypothetical protein
MMTSSGVNVIELNADFGTASVNLDDLQFIGVPGDFNDDRTVDAADYVFWRKSGIAEADSTSTPPDTETSCSDY